MNLFSCYSERRVSFFFSSVSAKMVMFFFLVAFIIFIILDS